ncbi:hypothetical protein GGS26DRAFT_601946 [Hypomontagnella submonticulosa]|nr:hypothetical protein GGS26DRAFT_601946 [Hypomontagnella submonticulosa]
MHSNSPPPHPNQFTSKPPWISIPIPPAQVRSPSPSSDSDRPVVEAKVPTFAKFPAPSITTSSTIPNSRPQPHPKIPPTDRSRARRQEDSNAGPSITGDSASASASISNHSQSDRSRAKRNLINKWTSRCQDEDNRYLETQKTPPSVDISVNAHSFSTQVSELQTEIHYYDLVKLYTSPNYRHNLTFLNVQFFYEPFPEYVNKIVHPMSRLRNDDITAEGVSQLCGEFIFIADSSMPSRAAAIFLRARPYLYLDMLNESLMAFNDATFRQDTLVHHVTNPVIRMAIPKPNVTVGYDPNLAFTQEFVLYPVLTERQEVFSPCRNPLWAPYLVVIVANDADGIDAAINHCITAATACVNLNLRLLPANDNVVFSLMIGIQNAEIFASWYDPNSGRYNTKRVSHFLLSDPASFVKLRRYIHNIHAWANEGRLQFTKQMLGRWRPPVMQH